MNKYLKYFLYILEHKKNVFIECRKRGLYLHAFTHDLSKFLPDEFFPYANWFYGKYGKLWKDNCRETLEQVMDDSPHFYNKKETREILYGIAINDTNEDLFNKAWSKHKKRNKHHWESPDWQFGSCATKFIISMPPKYINQMICDWAAMSRKFGDTVQEFYDKEKVKKNLSKYTAEVIQYFITISCKGKK